MHEYHRLRCLAGSLEYFLLIGHGIGTDHRRGREIAEHELVALLGDRRSGGDVDDERDSLLLGDLRDRRSLPGIEGSDQQLRALVDQLLGPRPRDLHVGLGGGLHDRELWQAEGLENAGRNLHTTVAVLPDAGLSARERQQNADLERGALCTREVEPRAGGKQSGGTDAAGETAAGHAGGFEWPCTV